MTKNSEELIAKAKEILRRELERCVENGEQPSYYECIYEAYMLGLADASELDVAVYKKAQDWHYVEIEGVPENDDTHWLLYEYDGKYQDTTHGYYEDGRWYLDYHPANCDYRVLAWHPLPKVAR